MEFNPLGGPDPWVSGGLYSSFFHISFVHQGPTIAFIMFDHRLLTIDGKKRFHVYRITS